MTAEFPHEHAETNQPSEAPSPETIVAYRRLLKEAYGEEAQRGLEQLSHKRWQTLINDIDKTVANMLPRREQEVIQLRFLRPGQVPSYQTVGQLMQPPISRSRAAQHATKSLRRLRHPKYSTKILGSLPYREGSVARELLGLEVTKRELWQLADIQTEELGPSAHLVRNALERSGFQTCRLFDFLIKNANLLESLSPEQVNEVRQAVQQTLERACNNSTTSSQPQP